MHASLRRVSGSRGADAVSWLRVVVVASRVVLVVILFSTHSLLVSFSGHQRLVVVPGRRLLKSHLTSTFNN